MIDRAVRMNYHTNLLELEEHMYPLVDVEKPNVFRGTYNVNKSLHWKKNNTWYQMHSMLLKFTAGGYDRLKNADRQEESKPLM